MPKDQAGNRIAVAKGIQLSGKPRTLRDAVGALDPNDFYRFQVKRVSSFNLTLKGLRAAAGVQLLNQRGQRLAAARGGKAAKSIYRNLKAGTYYIRVFGRQETGYRLELSARLDGAGDRPATARAVGNGTFKDWVGKSDRNDFYQVQLNADSQLDLALQGLVANANLQLLAGDGSVLQTFNQPGRTPEAANLNLKAGTYFVRVFFSGSKLGTGYQLSLSGTALVTPPANEPPPVNEPPPAPTPLPSRVALQSFVTGLSQPVHITNAADGSDRLFVVEQGGSIRIVKNGSVNATPFLNIRDRVSILGGEEGLLSVAFPPGYASKGYFYVYYTNRAGNNVVSRFRVSANPDIANPGSEEIVLTLNHPTNTNHNGGQLVFGSDGYLYIGTGDGGGGGDPNNNAQNPNSLLGKILRIDVETPSTSPYQIPASNPFVGNRDPQNQVRDEIWALGLRNPWRFSFDRQTHDLYIADVGQNAYEEVNFQSASSSGGENYGWRILEGSSRYNNSTQSTDGLTFPVTQYSHTEGRSITGGYVYRGAVSQLQGTYFYGDFANGKLWGLKYNGEIWENKLLLDTSYGISSFGEDEQGDLYLADYSQGTLYEVTA